MRKCVSAEQSQASRASLTRRPKRYAALVRAQDRQERADAYAGDELSMAGTVVVHYEDGSGLADLPCSRLRLTSTTGARTIDACWLRVTADPWRRKRQRHAGEGLCSYQWALGRQATVAGVIAPSFVAL